MTGFFSIAIIGCHLSLFDKFLYNVLHRFVFFSHLSPCAESIGFDLVSTINDFTLVMGESNPSQNRVHLWIRVRVRIQVFVRFNRCVPTVIRCWLSLWWWNIILLLHTVRLIWNDVFYRNVSWLQSKTPYSSTSKTWKNTGNLRKQCNVHVGRKAVNTFNSRILRIT